MSDLLSAAWTTTLLRLLAVLAAGLALGFLIGQPWPGLALAALAALLWHAWILRGVLLRLEARQPSAATSRRGVWGALAGLLDRGHAETRARRRRLLGLLRAYRTAAATLPDAILVVERNSQRLLWFNEAATRLLGLHYPHDRDVPLAKALAPLPMARWLAGGRNAETLRDVASPVDPALRLDLRLLPYSDDLWLLLVHDVSRLLHLEHMRRDFVANVSHELRTPLTVIHGYLELLDGQESAESAPLLAEMRRQSERMTRLVEDLLTLSRLEGNEEPSVERVPMQPLLAHLAGEAEALSAGRHCIRVEDAAGLDLRGAARDLHSAFSNLLSNAVRYTPAGGEITLRFARSANGGAALSVCDTGPGIPPEHLPRLTERFYRVSTSRSRDSGGTGLGLAIVKHVLGQHGARLVIDSTPGTGSVFSCCFPAERTLARAAASATSEAGS
ncbi:phosphate regulon sensor histidine kinase PhoR [Thermomonas sp.]|uniref:phosphate regulon sensor histidine kinase PhoR n=1 Tax=Thermomonas sp. TaxID=1971895 RepID=UPI002C0260E7|nr:phosphate regulon sensor histidine kinase PhoR [Thermomonas sp.]HRO64152.1 phosphate regulon sensor histidine kinase PhoR [Thermomonas sp.]